MSTRLGLGFIMILVLSACSSSPVVEKSPELIPGAKKKKKPDEEPPKEKKFEDQWRCKVLNGEGRTFVATENDRSVAQIHAKSECERQYRHCFILDCNLVEAGE